MSTSPPTCRTSSIAWFMDWIETLSAVRLFVLNPMFPFLIEVIVKLPLPVGVIKICPTLSRTLIRSSIAIFPLTSLTENAS